MRAPIQVLLELTLACNQRCFHCLARAGARTKEELSTGEVKAVLRSLHEAGVVDIALSGGEPLLRSDLCELLEFIGDLGPGPLYFLNTNAILWTDDEMQALARVLRRGCDLMIQVGLDGCDPATYNRVRNDTEENYYRVIENITRMKEHGLRVSAILTFTHHNAHRAINTAKFALVDLELEAFLVIPVFPAGRAMDNYANLRPSENEWDDFVVEVTNLKAQQAWKGKASLFNVGFFAYYQLAMPLVKAGLGDSIFEVWNYPKADSNVRLFARGGLCKAGKSELCITANGDVYPCVPARGGPFLLGNLRERPWTEMWNNCAVLDYFRTGRLDRFEEPCASCKLLSPCAGGCRVFAQVITGDPTKADPCCPEVVALQYN